MKVIVGLGNPGAKYAGTRHNVGFMVVERLAEAWGIAADRELCRSRVGEGAVQETPVRLVYPQTFMNSAGEAVACLLRRWRLEPSRLLIVLDDVALPLGMIRVRGGGSAGGHLGLTSVAQGAATEEIPRLRVGIAPPGKPSAAELTHFVLGRFTGAEKGRLEEGLASAERACEMWVTRGLTAAMNRFNRKARCQD